MRGINVGGKNLIAVDELVAHCESKGFGQVLSYLQSGNLILTSEDDERVVEKKLEALLLEKFNLAIPVLARKGSRFLALSRSLPFSREETEAPKLLHLALAKSPPARGAIESLRRRATLEERIEPAGRDGLWIHYTSGVARSKLSPAVLDRTVGSPVTARNLRTVRALAELVKGA